MSKRRLIRRMVIEQKKVERTALRQAYGVSRKYFNFTIRLFREGGTIQPGILEAKFEEIFLKPLSRALLAASLLGKKRGRLTVSRRKSLDLSQVSTSGLKLDTISDLTKLLTKQLDIENIDLLQEQWDTNALRMLNDVAPQIETTLRTTMNAITREGLGTTQGTAVLRDAFNSLGISPQKPAQIETIFRTQTAIAYNGGRWEEAQAPEIQEIIWGYEYATVDDNRVRPEHAAVDGTILPKDDTWWLTWWPPNGWNCRCQVLPVFEQQRIVAPPTEVQPDTGFSFNPGVVFG